MITRGQIVIFVMFALALTMGGVAVWWHDRQGHRAQEFWGTPSARLIRHATRVEALRLKVTQSTNESPAEAAVFKPDHALDITKRPGLVHARHALIEDASYDWSESQIDGDSDWDYALRFSEKNEALTVLFDSSSGRVGTTDSEQSAQLTSQTRSALSSYLADLVENSQE